MKTAERANAPLGLAIIAGFAALFLVVPWTWGRHPAAASDANTLFGAVFFGYAAAVLGAAVRYPDACFLFRFLARRPTAAFWALAFGCLSLWHFVVYLG